MARMIDSSYLLKHQRKVKFFGLGPDDESWGYAVPTEIIENAPTLTPPNEPLTLEELREMSGQPFWDDAGSVWWIVAHVEGSKIYTEEGAILDFYEEGEEDVYFRRPPEGEDA